jgi:hypothetical protein
MIARFYPAADYVPPEPRAWEGIYDYWTERVDTDHFATRTRWTTYRSAASTRYGASVGQLYGACVYLWPEYGEAGGSWRDESAAHFAEASARIGRGAL